MSKVFCIGYQKTGTTSLHVALKILGYNVCGFREDLVHEIISRRYDKVWAVVDTYEAFEDHPWPNLFKELDIRYPGSKFILTLRNEENWYRSCLKYFKHPHFVSRWLYGVEVPEGHKDKYLKTYNHHNNTVIKYFVNRPNDLLIMSLEDGGGWAQLCSFLNCSIPKAGFPHANNSKDPFRWYKESVFIAKILRMFPWLRTLKRLLFNNQ